MKQILRGFFFLTLSFLSLGAVVQKKGPVLKTQTDPVSYAEVAKEEAEGKKGPPAPTFELFPKEHFLVDDPVELSKTPAAVEEETGTDFWFEEDTTEPPSEVPSDVSFKQEGKPDDTLSDSVKEESLDESWLTEEDQLAEENPLAKN